MHPLFNFLTLLPATICHESEVMRMQDCCTSVLCAAALLVLSFGIQMQSTLGFGFPCRASRSGLASKARKKKRTAKKAPLSPQTTALLAKTKLCLTLASLRLRFALFFYDYYTTQAFHRQQGDSSFESSRLPLKVRDAAIAKQIAFATCVKKHH